MAQAHPAGGARLRLLGVRAARGVCADPETCSSVLFTLPLQHLESLDPARLVTLLLPLTRLGESLNAQQTSDAALKGLCDPC